MKSKFVVVDIDVEKVYKKNKKTKRDSWKVMILRDLRDKLREEYGEWNEIGKENDRRYIGKYKEEYEELLDIIVIARMLAERVRPK